MATGKRSHQDGRCIESRVILEQSPCDHSSWRVGGTPQWYAKRLHKPKVSGSALMLGKRSQLRHSSRAKEQQAEKKFASEKILAGQQGNSCCERSSSADAEQEG
jgi:hypothetical protein